FHAGKQLIEPVRRMMDIVGTDDDDAPSVLQQHLRLGDRGNHAKTNRHRNGVALRGMNDVGHGVALRGVSTPRSSNFHSSNSEICRIAKMNFQRRERASVSMASP